MPHSDEILQDMHTISPEEEEFLNYLEDRQQTGVQEQTKHQYNLAGTTRHLGAAHVRPNTIMNQFLC